MENRYGVGDNEIGPYQAPEDDSEHEASQQETSTEGLHGRKVRTSGNEEWRKQQALQQEKKKTPQERLHDLEKAVKGFRIETSGDGNLRGRFGKLPDNPAKDLLNRISNLSKAMDQFHLTGDNLTVSGSFDKGYTVQRENPCDQQQVNQEPT